MSYLYLIFSAGCSVLLVHLMKAAEERRHRMLNTFTINYLVAAVFAFSVGGIPSPQLLSGFLGSPIVLFSAVTGSVFIGNFLVYSKSIHLNGMGISVAAMRLSLLIPVFLSIWLYQETVTWGKITGLILVFLALGLMVPKQEPIKFRKIDAAWLLVIVFVLTGMADSTLKIYQEDFSLQLSELQFMGLVFTCAFIIGLVLSLIRRGEVIKRGELVTGVLIGIPNLYSSVFLIYALGGIDGAIAYPIVNILNVTGGTLLGIWVWKDSVSKLQWMGLGVALVAILLLV